MNGIRGGKIKVNKLELTKFIKTRINQNSAAMIGGFAGTFDFGDQLLLASADGIGTKLNVSEWVGDFTTIGIDLVAQNVNDIVCHGGKPLFFLDYFSCNRLNTSIFEQILSGVNKGCEEAGCLLIGGEVAELIYTYTPGGCDLAGFAVGVVDKNKYLPKSDEIVPGDLILGLASNGLHANGFTKLLERTKNNIDLKSLLAPTRIYSRSCLNVLKQTDQIKALVHITGGGFNDNIPRVLQPGLGFKLRDWAVPEIFKEIKIKGNFTQQEMLDNFNCGIGMAVIIDKRQAERICSLFNNEGEKVQVIGDVTGFYKVT
jgi:phosphoribosylformylglycinamidine cyclo-ligase